MSCYPEIICKEYCDCCHYFKPVIKETTYNTVACKFENICGRIWDMSQDERNKTIIAYARQRDDTLVKKIHQLEHALNAERKKNNS